MQRERTAEDELKGQNKTHQTNIGHCTVCNAQNIK